MDDGQRNAPVFPHALQDLQDLLVVLRAYLAAIQDLAA